jgi:hypothetical protein
VGGSAQEWGAILPSDLVPGSDMALKLVMTKFGSPSVRVGYEVFLKPGE